MKNTIPKQRPKRAAVSLYFRRGKNGSSNSVINLIDDGLAKLFASKIAIDLAYQVDRRSQSEQFMTEEQKS